MRTLYDEADYIIPQQVESAIHAGNTVIKVLSSDTDVFVVLCSLYTENNWSPAEVYMDDFEKNKHVVSIRKTAEKHKAVCSMLIRVHAISGCDTVPMMFGIGKLKALKTLASNPLHLLGRIDAGIEDVY